MSSFQLQKPQGSLHQIRAEDAIVEEEAQTELPDGKMPVESATPST